MQEGEARTSDPVAPVGAAAGRQRGYQTARVLPTAQPRARVSFSAQRKVQQKCWTFFSRKLLPPVASRHPTRVKCRNLLPTVILVCDRKLLDDADISYQGEFLGYTLYNIDDADDGQDIDDGVQNPGHGRRKSSDKPA